MTPEETALLTSYGAVLYYNIIELITVSALYGFYLLAALLAGKILLSSPTKRTSQWVLLCCTFLGAATLTLNFLCGTVLSLKLTYYLLINIGKDLSTQGDIAAQKAFTWEVISIWPNQIVFILSDCIITWRAWVVWPNQRYVKAVILFLAVGNFVLQIVDPVFDTLEITETSSITIDLDVISSGVSLAMNGVITGLIGLKAWKHRKQLQDMGSARLTGSQRVLLLWVESGVVFCLFQLLFTIFSALNLTAVDDGPVSIATRVLTAVTTNFAGLYPTLLLIMVNLGISMLEETASLQNDASSSTGTVYPHSA